MKKRLSLQDVVAQLRKQANEAGSQKLLAEKMGVTPQYITDILKGRREPGEAVLKPLGLRKVVSYESEGE